MWQTFLVIIYYNSLSALYFYLNAENLNLSQKEKIRLREYRASSQDFLQRNKALFGLLREAFQIQFIDRSLDELFFLESKEQFKQYLIAKIEIALEKDREMGTDFGYLFLDILYDDFVSTLKNLNIKFYQEEVPFYATFKYNKA